MQNKRRLMIIISAIMLCSLILQEPYAVYAKDTAELPETDFLTNEYEIKEIEETKETDEGQDLILEDGENTENNESIRSAEAEIDQAVSSQNTETTLLDLSDEVIQFGGFPKERTSSDFSGSAGGSGKAREELIEKLENGIAMMKTSIDISKYNLTVDEVQHNIEDVFNHNPTFFNVEKVYTTYNKETTIVSEVQIVYLSGSYDRMLRYEKEVSKILSGIKESWTDFEKIIYLHDYLVTHCDYDHSLTRHSAYDAIVDQLCVCSGYAFAFEDLGNRAGVKTFYVSSEVNNHAWNLVELNGAYFYIDCTWDDCGVDDETPDMSCAHRNLLCSQSQMQRNGHEGTDWVSCLYSGSSYIYGIYDDKTYDEAPWKSTCRSSIISLGNGRIVFLDEISYSSDSLQIYEYDHNNNNKKHIGDFRSFHHKAVTLTSVDNNIYINDEWNIGRIDVSAKSWELVYTLSTKERELGIISGIEGIDTKIRYDITRNGSYSSFVKSEYVNLSDAVPDVTSVKLNKNYINLKKIGDREKIEASVVAQGVRDIIWTSSNPSVISVDNGMVTAKKNIGWAVVYARAGFITAECVVSVGEILTLNTTKIELLSGEESDIEAILDLGMYWEEHPVVEWSCSDNSIVSLTMDPVCSDCIAITGKKPGKAYIYASILQGTACCEVVVRGIDTPVITGLEPLACGIKITYDTASGADEYQIFRRINNGEWYYIADLNETTYTDYYACVNGAKYEYKVYAFKWGESNHTLKSEPSSVKEAYYLSCPTIKSLKNTAKKAMTIKWGKNTKGTGYQIEYSTSKNFTNSKKINISKKKTVSKKIAKLKKNKTYYVRIRSYKKVGTRKYYSQWSSPRKIKIKK